MADHAGIIADDWPLLAGQGPAGAVAGTVAGAMAGALGVGGVFGSEFVGDTAAADHTPGRAGTPEDSAPAAPAGSLGTAPRHGGLWAGALRRGLLHQALTEIAAGTAPVLITAPRAVVSPLAAAFCEEAYAALCGTAAGSPPAGDSLVDHPLIDKRDAGSPRVDILGLSLSRPRYRPGTRVPFEPLPDGADVFRARPLPDAAAWFTPAMAARILAAWPPALVGKDQGWFAALRALGGYLLLPRVALAHDGGKHPAAMRLLAQGGRDWRLTAPSGPLAIYDERWEPAAETVRRLCPIAIPGTLAVDLLGDATLAELVGDSGPTPPSGHAEERRRDRTAEWLLSARPCRQPLARFAIELVPLEANLAAPLPPAVGDAAVMADEMDGSTEEFCLYLGRVEDFVAYDGGLARQRVERHMTRHNALSGYFRQLLGPLRIPGFGRGRA